MAFAIQSLHTNSGSQHLQMPMRLSLACQMLGQPLICEPTVRTYRTACSHVCIVFARARCTCSLHVIAQIKLVYAHVLSGLRMPKSCIHTIFNQFLHAHLSDIFDGKTRSLNLKPIVGNARCGYIVKDCLVLMLVNCFLIPIPRVPLSAIAVFVQYEQQRSCFARFRCL